MPATKTGTFDISSLLATRDQSVAEFGEDTVAEVLQRDIDAHNRLVAGMLAELAESTTDRQRRYGTSLSTDMVETDEYGRAPTQKEVPGATVGFPLRKFQYATGWTEDWFFTHTPRDAAVRTRAAQKAHMKALRREIQRALFLSSNYTFVDHLVDNVELAVKRLVNADSAPIPDGPNGETFAGSSHTHFNANASLTAAVLKATIQDVVEHGHGGMVKVAIARADQADFEGLTGFKAYPDPRLRPSEGDPFTTRDISRLDNMAIGVFDAAEIWVKPWGIANYAFAWDADDPNRPLAYRQHEQSALQGLRLAAQFDTFPLHAEYMRAYFGFGVWTRTNGAVLHFDNGTYEDPSI